MRELNAGPELDALIARHVMGWFPVGTPAGIWWYPPKRGPVAPAGPPPYSQDTPEGWAAMRAVLQHFADGGWQIDIWHEHGEDGGCWGAQLLHWGLSPQCSERTVYDSTPIWATTLPYAVALAALAAVGAREGE